MSIVALLSFLYFFLKHPSVFRDFAMKDEFKLNASNFVVEGPTLMSHSALMKFLTRCLLVLVLSIVAQLPKAMGVKVDSDAFMGAFYYVDEDGTNHQVGHWTFGPGWRNRDGMAIDDDITNTYKADSADFNLTDQQSHLVSRWKVWSEHENKYGAHIPSTLCCLPKITLLEGWMHGQPLPKIKPLLFKKGRHENNTSIQAELSDGRFF